MTTRFRTGRTSFYRLFVAFATCLLITATTYTLPAQANPEGMDEAVFFGNATALPHSFAWQKCHDGLILSVWQPTEGISIAERVMRVCVYMASLAYLFIGSSILCDRFMAAVEVITSTEKEVQVKKGGVTKVVVVRVWNETVANLTLISLGTSTPEILLTVIEIFARNFEAGDLGPSTVVGSAAYNLFMIIAICISAVPSNEVRRIKYLQVFVVTSLWSLFAYVWMYAILAWITPGRVDIWEGVLTVIFFPITVLHAYLAHRGLLCHGLFAKKHHDGKESLESSKVDGEKRRRPAVSEESDFEESRQKYLSLLKELRKKHPQYDVEQLEAIALEQLIDQSPKSRLFYRIQAIHKMMGSGDIMRKMRARALSNLNDIRADLHRVDVSSMEEDAILRVFFEPGHYTVMESCGEFVMRVVRRGDISFATKIEYWTEDGTAEAGSDYVEKSGVLTFPPGVEEQLIKIEVMDDDVFEQDEYFYVHLGNPSEPAVLTTPYVATVMILDDDHAGIFTFSQASHELSESVGVYKLAVQRYSGARGKVLISYNAEDGTARAGKHFEPLQGELEFNNNETEKFIDVYINQEGSYEKDVFFYVNLSNPRMAPDDELTELIQTAESKPREELNEEEKMALLGRPKAGDVMRTEIRIRESKRFQNTVDRLIKGANTANLVGTSSWKQQFTDALTVSTAGDNEDEEMVATSCDYIMHFITLPWKIFCALIPPTDIYNGYLCFFCSLVLIGGVTSLLGDVACQLGCTMLMDDSVTAILFVAVGTSLPDTFASKNSAVRDEYADNSIGNVTGSNAVIVFFGIGMAWTVGAVYHTLKGGHFEVLPGCLAFPLSIYFMGSVITILVLLMRRGKPVGGELGGPAHIKYLSSLLLFLLWIVYVVLSILQTYGVIKGF